MVQEQEVELTVMDAGERNATDHKITQIKNILKEEGVEDDPELLSAFDDAVKHAVKGEVVDEEI